MKKYLFILAVLFSAVGLYATRPTTTANVTHPATFSTVSTAQTNVTVVRPGTQTIVKQPNTQVSVTRPTTQVPVLRPTTQTSIARPGTLGSVSHPVTTQTVTKPATPFVPSLQTSSSPFGGTMGGMNGSSYTPTYKNIKTFTPPSSAANATQAEPASETKAAKLGQGQAGLRLKDESAADKEALAAQERPKGESSQISVEDVIKKTKMPEGLNEKLQQKSEEARKAAGK